MSVKPVIRVFLASPNDVEEERRIFGEVIERLSTDSGFYFQALAFEDALASTGQRPQDIINGLVDQCDVFILIFYRRWGQYSSDSVAYTGYTEEEFERAKRRFIKTRAPEIFCFFRHVDLLSIADPGEQLTKVLEFRRRIEESHQVLYREFGTSAQFAVDLEKHLLAFAKGELPTPRNTTRHIHLPILADRKPETERLYDLAMMRQAQHAAESGRIEEASALFARLSQSRNIEVLDVSRQFFIQIGNSDAAQAVLERKLTLLYDRRLAAYEYVAVMESQPWIEDIIAGTVSQTPIEQRDAVEHSLRELFTGTRFRELMIESMAKHLTVGELIALAHFYGGDGGTIARKMGHYIGVEVTRIISLLSKENPDLFKK